MSYNYVPNPGYPSNIAVSPCTNPDVAPQKICGSVTPPGPGETVQVDWLEFTKEASGAASSLTGGSTILARKASISAPDTNSDDVGVGPTSAADLYNLPSGVGGYVIENPDGTSFDLANWFALAASGSQQLKIAYLPG